MTIDRQENLARLERARLYAIVDAGYLDEARMLPVLEALLAGGTGIVQLRAKDRGPDEYARLGRMLLPPCRAAGVPFIINDFPEVAAAIDADGAHVGQDDGSLDEVRAVVGPDLLVGRSTHSLDQAATAEAEGFDYLGFGPLFPTATKPGRPAIGLDDIAEVHRLVRRPVFCIGGVNKETLPAVLAAGARRVVVVSALLTAPDPETATREALRVLGE